MISFFFGNVLSTFKSNIYFTKNNFAVFTTRQLELSVALMNTIRAVLTDDAYHHLYW